LENPRENLESPSESLKSPGGNLESASRSLKSPSRNLKNSSCGGEFESEEAGVPKIPSVSFTLRPPQ